MKNEIQPAADTLLVNSKVRAVEPFVVQKKKSYAFLLKPEYQFWSSPTRNHPPCLRKKSSAGFTHHASRGVAEEPLAHWCRELPGEGSAAPTSIPRVGRVSAASFRTGECLSRGASKLTAVLPASLFVFLL